MRLGVCDEPTRNVIKSREKNKKAEGASKIMEMGEEHNKWLGHCNGSRCWAQLICMDCTEQAEQTRSAKLWKCTGRTRHRGQCHSLACVTVAEIGLGLGTRQTARRTLHSHRKTIGTPESVLQIKNVNNVPLDLCLNCKL